MTVNTLKDKKRIVVKVGSALLVDVKTGKVHRKWLESLVDDIAQLKKAGHEVILVSSGAVAVGRRYLDLPVGPLKLEEKQAAASSGMIHLAYAYQATCEHHGMSVAQILLTLDDSENRRRYLNARNTMETLLKLGAIPLINENDSVATDEIRMGDNDRLGARVAAMTSADLLVLLSDIDGMYTADPKADPAATFLNEIAEITPEIEAMAGSAGTHDGTGGMVTKLAAAKIALGAGCSMVITNGHTLHPLKSLKEGGKATWFRAQGTPRSARKGWIVGSLKAVGAIIVDEGAVAALNSGKSLLPIGVKAVEGKFDRGDAVSIKTPDGIEIGKGLVAYSAADAHLIQGRKSDEIETRLGYRGRSEMIHRDDLVLHQK